MYQGETDRTGQGKKMGVSKYAGVFTYVCILGFFGRGIFFRKAKGTYLNQNPIQPYLLGGVGVKFDPL